MQAQSYTKKSFFSALMLALAICIAVPCFARNNGTQEKGWDNTVNSLLAASMYGFHDTDQHGLSVQLQHSDDFMLDLQNDSKELDAESITLSYGGSSGLLGFSAGYIYTDQQNSADQGQAFLGIDPTDDQEFSPAKSWFLALNLSHSYQVDQDLMFGFGGKTLLTKNPFDTEEGKTFSMLFNMPISIKNYVTITPQFQWSRTLPDEDSLSTLDAASEEKQKEDVFYGGVSLSFSY